MFERVTETETPISFSDLVLEVLQKSKLPLTLSDIAESLPIPVTEDDIRIAISSLSERGYDIKEITRGDEELYVLVRFFDLSEDEVYRVHGNIETPLLLTSDWHFGSVNFQKKALLELKTDVIDYDIQSVMIAGDLIQGRNVFRTELQELAIPSITKQVTGVTSILRDFPCDIHLISGNHEEKVKGSVMIGYDPLKTVASSLDNCTYYGHVAMLRLDDDYKYMMVHGGGSLTQATTHMVEKIWRELKEKPNILHVGHLHQEALVVKDRGKTCIMSGTLQRTSAWLLSKGWNAKICWVIIYDITDDYAHVVFRTPKVL